MANGLFGGGNGTQESPYLIEDLLDLNAIRNYPNLTKYFKVMNDIDASLESLEAVGLGNGGKGWIYPGGFYPDGSLVPFKVTINFNFKKISNLYMKTDGLACPFGFISNGYFFNFNFENFDITSTYGDAFGLFSKSYSSKIRNGKISGFKVKSEKNASLISGPSLRGSSFVGIYIDNSLVESKENASFFFTENENLATSFYKDVVQLNVILNSSLKSKNCTGLGDAKYTKGMYYSSLTDKEIVCYNTWNYFLNCKFMGTETNAITDVLPYGKTTIKYYNDPDYPDTSIVSFGSTFEGPHSNEMYNTNYLTETQVKTASTYKNIFESTNIKVEDGSIPYFYIDTSPTFPAEVKTATGKDGSTTDPSTLNTALSYALDFNNWWIIDEGLSAPYKPSFYVKEVGSAFPETVKTSTGKDGEDIAAEAALKEISYALDFNNWWITDSDTKIPYKPSFYVKDVGSCVPLPVKSLTGKDGLDISESDACKKATYAFNWSNTPFIIEDGLSSPSMNYFSGGVVIEILSGKFSKPFETGIKASVFETIVYTTDGTDPSKTSKVLSNGDKVKISESCVLKARTFDSVFVGGQYYDFLSEISKETYVISFKSVFDELMNKVKFKPNSEVDSYIDEDSEGNKLVRIIKNVDEILTVYRNGEEISEYFCDKEMADYDFDDSEELVYSFYKEDGEFLCNSVPSKVAKNYDEKEGVISEVSDIFLELYNSYDDLAILKDYIKGYKDIYEFINSVVKLKNIKECIDEDLTTIENLLEVRSSLESRLSKVLEIKNIDSAAFFIDPEVVPELVNCSDSDVVNIGVDTTNG